MYSQISSTYLAIITLFTLTFFHSCKKDECNANSPTQVASAAETSTLQNYLNTNGISATQHTSGMFYKILNEGSGGSPNLCSNVSVQYTGKLLDGTQFDASSSTITFKLSNLIIGWQYGIPLLKKGAEANFYIPSSLGYGSIAQNGIPANSNLIFNIKLIAFQDAN